MERSKILKSIIGYVFFTVFSVAMYFWIIPAQIKISTWNSNIGFTAQTFPRLTIIVIGICGVLGLIKELTALARLPKNSEKSEKFDLRRELTPLLLTVAAIIYYVLFNKIGFIWSTVIMVPLTLGILRCRKWQYYLYVYLFSFFIYAVFVFVLKVMLP